MKALMLCNQGLKRRFSTRLDFPDFNVEDAMAMMRLLLKKENVQLAADANEGMPTLMKQVCQWVWASAWA